MREFKGGGSIMSNKFHVFFISLILVISLISPAGHFTGNGGDHVRGTFLIMGEAVINFLKETNEGKSILSDHQINIDSLAKILNIDTIVAIEDN